MYIYIIAGLALLALVMFVGIKVFRSWKARRQIEQERDAKWQANLDRIYGNAERWIEQIEAAESDDEILAAGAYPEDAPRLKFGDRLKEALDKFKNAQYREDRRATVQGYVEKYFAEASTPAERAELCVELYREGYLEDVLELTKETVGERIVELMLEELSAARDGDAKALLRFLDFRRSHQIYRQYSTLRTVLSEEQKEALAFPGDWDDMVTELLETPSIYDFQFIQRQPVPGTIRLVAAQALDERSLKLGKIVLAFCSEREEVVGDAGHRGSRSRQAVWPYREEIGDVLLAEVAKMVHTIHAKRGMFVGRT